MILFILAFYQSLCLLAKKHINERKANGAEERKRENMDYMIVSFLKKIFYWSIVDLQCCVSFRYTAK